MVKDPDEIFDLDAIASRNLAEAHLRAEAFNLAIRFSQWHDVPGHRPSHEIAILANTIYRWLHTGEWVN